ncbi:MAG: c-type cytochrome [Pirellulaceae bacterium]
MERPVFLSVLFVLGIAPSTLAQTNNVDDVASKAGNEQVAEIMRTFAPRGVQSDGSEPTDPATARQMFHLDAGLTVDLVASEPDVSQPLFVTWDSRGRMWVVQYRQYQYPAGLKVVRYDQHLRAVFDKVPEPPPRGVRGADKITVLEDRDHDGTYEHHHNVITGLNIATSVQLGRGGIWVLNPPYLLFYPDADQDDVPDGDPEVHLSGFGLEDTHSVANSLMWGPDGWLYGANGSTTTGTVSSQVTKGVSFQGQCIWRYHPDTKVFEIYAEGGGNTFSLDIDAQGRVFSGTNGGGTRGFYYPQGSYSSKNWGKHGPLTNPYAFGFLEQMRSQGDERRFPQAMLVYDGGLLPERFAGNIIAPNAMHNLIWHSQRLPDGSTFQTIDQANLLETSDRWFRPVYAGVGPDGAIYVADWYDTRLSHVSPLDDWHKESGRVYRIRPSGQVPVYSAGDLSRQSVDSLIELFAHRNKWVRWRAMLELGWRGNGSHVDELSSLVDRGSLESLWCLHLMSELSGIRAAKWIESESPDIRRWTVRLIGDRAPYQRDLATELSSQGGARQAAWDDSLAYEAMIRQSEIERDLGVREQLAATAKRVPTQVALPVIRNLISFDQDAIDPHQPLMLWWAVEAHCSDWEQLEHWLQDRQLWVQRIFREVIVQRLMRRYASETTAPSLAYCSRLMELAPDDLSRDSLIAGLNAAFQGRTLPPLPDVLSAALNKYRESRGNSGVALALRQGDPAAVAPALAALRDNNVDAGTRIELANAFGQVPHPEAIDVLLQLATGGASDEPALQRVAIAALAIYDDPRIPQRLTSAFDQQISAEHNLRDTACRTLATRPQWAQALCREVLQWRLKVRDVPADVVQQLRAHTDSNTVVAVEKAFGKPVAISSPEKVAAMARWLEVATKREGVIEVGEALFAKHCATCHQLFGKGETIGPALDGYDRGNPRFWLTAIVAPSIEIREGFQSYRATMDDGRIIVGMIADQGPSTVTIRTAENARIVLDRDHVEELTAMSTSLMPEDLLKDFSDQQLQALIAYVSQGARR